MKNSYEEPVFEFMTLNESLDTIEISGFPQQGICEMEFDPTCPLVL